MNNNEKENEEIINNLIQTEFIELKDEDLSKYNYEDIFRESLNTINDLEASLNQTTNTNKKEESEGNIGVEGLEESVDNKTEEKEKIIEGGEIPIDDEKKEEKEASIGNTEPPIGNVDTPTGNKEASNDNEIKDSEKSTINTEKLKLNDDNNNKNNSEKDLIKRKSQSFTKKTSSSSLDDYEFFLDKDIVKNYLINPINFVDYLECEQPKEKMKEIKNEFILKKYEEENHTKFEILNINTDTKLNQVIFPENEILTLIQYYEDSLITSNVLGQAKIYSISDKRRIKLFPYQIKSDKIYQITSMEITDDRKHIFIGYANGNIAMFDTKNQKLKILINNIINNCECLCIKFIHKNNKIYRIFVSDQLGEVFLINIKEGLMGFKLIEKQKIYENKDYPVYFIKLIEFNDKLIKSHPFLKNLKKYIIFGTLKSIEVFSLINFSKINFVFEIERPEWIEGYPIGDITLGVGKTPLSRDNLGEDNDDPQILMCVSYDNIIRLFNIPIDSGELLIPVLKGHYFNINKDGNNQIVRIGFYQKEPFF
jgi:hypothetical protein